MSNQPATQPTERKFKPITSPDEIKTQRDAVVYHLIMLHGITSMEAFVEWGITRLSGIIYNLRHDEFLEIETENITRKNRFDHPVTFAKYKLILKPKTNELYTQQELAV